MKWIVTVVLIPFIIGATTGMLSAHMGYGAKSWEYWAMMMIAIVPYSVRPIIDLVLK